MRSFRSLGGPNRNQIILRKPFPELVETEGAFPLNFLGGQSPRLNQALHYEDCCVLCINGSYGSWKAQDLKALRPQVIHSEKHVTM